MVPSLLKKCARVLVERCCWPFLLAVLYLIRPFRQVKIGLLRADRIGHLAMNTEVFLRRLQLGRLPASPVRVFVAAPAGNRQLLAMYKRHLRIVESRVLTKFFGLWEKRLSKTPFYEPLAGRSNEYDEFGLGRATLNFTIQEEERGKAALARLGIREDDWFVCFHNRDSAYLDRAAPKQDWSYHDYRNCDVRNFLSAADYVAQRGGYALRMGAAVDDPLPIGLHARIIDYATLHRDDFLDIYLIAKCRFMIGSDTGLAQVATAFDVPVVNTNVPRIDWAAFRPQDIFIQKKLFDESLGRLLTYPEILAKGHQLFVKSSYLAEHRLRLVENTPEEILEAAREMTERLDGTLQETPEDGELQERYRRFFSPAHSCCGYKSRIGRDFLRRNRDIVFGDSIPGGGVA